MAPSPTTTSEPVYRVLEPFSFDHNGRTYVMRKGDIVAADNPAYGGGARAALFEEVTAQAAREAEAMRTKVSAVETTTAAPGEQRRMEIDASVPQTQDPIPPGVEDSVPPGPTTPAPTGEPPTPAPPSPPPTPAPTGPQGTADAPASTTKRTRAVKDQPQA